MRIATTIIGGLIGIALLQLGSIHEILALEIAIFGGLWLGALAGCLAEAPATAAGIVVAILSSFVGFLVVILGIGILLAVFGLAIFLLNNPVTRNVIYMPGSLSKVILTPLIPIVFGALAWTVSRLLGWLDDSADDWILGMMGTLKSCLSLVPIALLALGAYLALTRLGGIVMPRAVIVVYVFAVGALHGWFVPKAVKLD